MFKHATLKLATVLFAIVPITLTVGCRESVLGPESDQPTQASFAKATQPELPEILPVVAPREADLTGDGFVDASDLAAWSSTLIADMNGDNTVEERDLVLLVAVMRGAPVDCNGDGYVDASDFAAYARALRRADLTRDGLVDASDLAAFATKRGQGDVNRDGSVTRADQEVITRHLGQQITPA